jgi:hypothetical protein
MRRETLVAVLCGMAFAAGCAKDGRPHGMAAAAEAEVCHAGDGVTENAAAQKAAPVAKFGAEPTIADAEAVPVSTLLANPEQYKGRRVRLTNGTVTSVCAKKGCWLRVAPKDAAAAAGGARFADVFIKFTDPSTGRLVPMEAVGHDAVIEGVVKVGQMSQAAARHFKMDAGAPKEEVEKVVGPQPQIALGEASVLVRGVEQPKAGE